MLPFLQVIHMGAACPTTQRSYQRAGRWPGTCGSDLLLPQSAPTYELEWWGWTSLVGDLECFFSVDPCPVLLQWGEGQMPPHVSAMDLVILCRCMLLVNWTLCLYQPSVARFLWLVRQSFPNRGGSARACKCPSGYVHMLLTAACVGAIGWRQLEANKQSFLWTSALLVVWCAKFYFPFSCWNVWLSTCSWALLHAQTYSPTYAP